MESDDSTSVLAKTDGKRKREIELIVLVIFIKTAWLNIRWRHISRDEFIAAIDIGEGGKKMITMLADEIKEIDNRYRHFDLHVKRGLIDVVG